MPNRRKFLSDVAIVSLGGTTLLGLDSCNANTEAATPVKPVVISTWANLVANEEAWKSLEAGGSALDAVEQGAKVPEADPQDTSVGYGGMPDRDGDVTLDACIMNSEGNYGAVCFLKGIKHPISVARLVMEETPHVILAGEGALDFALSQGFVEEDLLTDNARKAWVKWKEREDYQPKINKDSHDTIGILALDNEGNLSGACTTSGLAFKLKGRVGDSPIIGAGLFVDNEVGAASATGMGEEVLKTVGSFLIVELMRQGMHPQKACEEAISRIVKGRTEMDFQVGYIALNKQGQHGAFSIKEGFEYALHINQNNQVYKSGSHLD